MASATEMHDRVMAGFAELRALLSKEHDQPAAQARADGLARQRMAASDADILAEYRSAGIASI